MTLTAAAQAIGQALVDLGGRAGPGDAGRAAGLDPRSTTRGLQALRALALVDGPKGEVRLTSAGWSHFAAASQGLGAGDVLESVLALWSDLGLYAHRAALELLWSAMVARHHLADSRPAGHLGLMALGETGTGKSALAGMTCAVFGLDPVTHTLYVPQQTVGSVLGRREREAGTGQRWVPAPAAALAFVLFDEFDKADEPVRRAVLPYFQGDVDVMAEGHRHRLAPTPMLAANPRGERLRLLPPEYRRRAVVLDTAYAADRGGDIERALTDFYAQPRPNVQLAGLQPPATALPPAALEVLRLMSAALTPEGVRQRPPLRSLESAALGRAALMGPGTDPVLAAYATVVSYLQVAEQLPGEVMDGWQIDANELREALGAGAGVEALARAMAQGRQHRRATQQRVAVAAVADEVADQQLLGDRAALAAELELAHQSLDARTLRPQTDADKIAAKALRAQLSRKRTEVLDSRSRGRLDELRQVVTGPLARAGVLVEQLRQAKSQAERNRTAEQLTAQQARRDAQDRTRQVKENARTDQAWTVAELGRTREQARRLESLYKRTTTRAGDLPFQTLAALGLLTYTPSAQPSSNGSAFLSMLSTALAPSGSRPATGQWTAFAASRSFPGDRQDCPALRSWGEASRAVLRAPLDELHRYEDQLAARSGRSGRSGRPLIA